MKMVGGCADEESLNVLMVDEDGSLHGGCKCEARGTCGLVCSWWYVFQALCDCEKLNHAREGTSMVACGLRLTSASEMDDMHFAVVCSIAASWMPTS
ncbi:hypothetical protein DEO72_LG3g1885 [Vigna unguiculata]|uniref:Uncharacterized protein n=1 Tax=Vigna unguiculata TaxID=3917 RepID=A0A4D6LFG4_VIGUN|nr:hypothetical protein DEO72_LG3g1885 [Vigna unguiculata]